MSITFTHRDHGSSPWARPGIDTQERYAIQTHNWSLVTDQWNVDGSLNGSTNTTNSQLPLKPSLCWEEHFSSPVSIVSVWTCTIRTRQLLGPWWRCRRRPRCWGCSCCPWAFQKRPLWIYSTFRHMRASWSICLKWKRISMILKHACCT